MGQDRRPQGQFLIGQWQSGKSQIVLPKDAATATIAKRRRVTGRRPGGVRSRRPGSGMTEFVQTIILGLLIGGVYALMASGLTLIFGVMNVINIAHGAFLILAAFLTYSLWTATGSTRSLAIAITTPAMFALRLAALRRRDPAASASAPAAASVLLTFSLALVLEGVMGLIWGNTSHAVRPAYFNQSFHVGELFLPKAQVYGCLVAVGVLVALWLFLTRTWTGPRDPRERGQPAGRAARRASTSPRWRR